MAAVGFQRDRSTADVLEMDVTGPIPETFAISTFDAPALTNTTPTLHQFHLDELVRKLTRHTRRRNKNGAGWSGARFKEGTTRASKNVIEWSVAAGDFDHITLAEYEELRRHITSLKLSFVLYSTYSSNESEYRFRLVLWFTTPIPAVNYPDIWLRINHHVFLGMNDKNTKDASRMLYLPTAPPDVAVVAEYVPGLALDWTKLPPIPVQAQNDGRDSRNRTGTPRISKDVLSFLALGAPVGDQRRLALRASRSLLSAGYDVDTTAEKVHGGLITSPVGDPGNPWTLDEVRAMVEDLDGREPPPLESSAAVNVAVSVATDEESESAPGSSPEEPSDSPATTDLSTIEEARERFDPMSLEEVCAVFRRWLYLPDTGPLLVVLAAFVANLIPGDPLWLMLVGPSSGGKTEILNALASLLHVRLAAVLTEASLLSGTSKRETVKEAKGGLLQEIGPFGILLLKDFTSILSMNRDPRAALLAALREIYDGSWTRHVGTDGGRTLSWRGKLGLIGCCTTIIDTYHAVMAAMGERFLLYRLPEIDGKAQATRALRNAGREAEMRTELTRAIGGLVAGIALPDSLPELTEKVERQLVALSCLGSRSRSAVDRDGRTREIDLIPDAEAPARIVQALRRVYSGLLIIGVDSDEAWNLTFKVGLDCMPKLRRSVFEYLVTRRDWISTKAIATGIGYPTQTARRSLEDLMVHALVLRQPAGKGNADNWMLSDMARQWYVEAQGTVPEMSVAEGKVGDAECSVALFESEQCIGGDYSGTPSESGAESNSAPCWRCKARLLSPNQQDRCERCNWLICPCGACSIGCEAEVIEDSF